MERMNRRRRNEKMVGILGQGGGNGRKESIAWRFEAGI